MNADAQTSEEVCEELAAYIAPFLERDIGVHERYPIIPRRQASIAKSQATAARTGWSHNSYPNDL